MKNKNLELKSITYLFLEYFVKICTGLITNITVVRTLGPELNGKFSYVLSYSTVLMPLYVMGINEYMIKDLKHGDHDLNQIMGTAFFIKLIGGLVATLIVIIAVIFTESEMTNIVLIIFMSFFLTFKSFETIDNWYLYKVDSKRISLLRNLVLLFSSGLKIGLCLLGFSWEYITAIAILDSFFFIFPYLYLYCVRDENSLVSWSLDQALLKKYFKNSFQFLIVSMISGFVLKVDQVFIGKILGDSSLGVYSAATRLVEFWQFAPMILISVFFPKIVEIHHNNKDDLDLFLSKFYSFITIGSMIFALLVTLISGFAIELLYGVSYEESSKLLSLYVWVVIPVYFWWARMRVAVVTGHVNSEIKVSIMVLFMTVIGYSFFIPHYGSKAAILTLIGAIIVSNLVVSIFDDFVKISITSFVKSFFNYKYVIDQLLNLKK